MNLLLKKTDKTSYFYNVLDGTPVTIDDIHNWYEKNSKDITSYESGFDTFDKYFESLFGLDTDLVPITKKEYVGLLNGTYKFDITTSSVLEKDICEELDEFGK